MIPEFGTQTTRFVPAWVRWAAVAIVATLFVAAAAMLVASVYLDGRQDWATPAAAFAETAGTGLLVVLVIFFFDRGRSRQRIDALSRTYFLADLPRALRQIDYARPAFAPWHDGWSDAAPLASNVTVAISYADGAFRADYLLRLADAALAIGVELNVRRCGLVYHLPGSAAETPQAAFAAMTDTFKGAQNAGWHIGTAQDSSGARPDLCAAFGAARCLSHTLHRNLEEGFLHDPLQRQFLAQDLAIMTRALLAERTHAIPGP